MPTVNKLLYRAKTEISSFLSCEVFLVSNLFKGYKWNRISRSDRLLLGTLILSYTKIDEIGVVPIGKTSSEQQRYKKQPSVIKRGY